MFKFTREFLFWMLWLMAKARHMGREEPVHRPPKDRNDVPPSEDPDLLPTTDPAPPMPEAEARPLTDVAATGETLLGLRGHVRAAMSRMYPGPKPS